MLARRPGLDETLLQRTRTHYDQYPLEFIGSGGQDVRALQPRPLLAFADAWLGAGRRVIDVGCGPGRALLLLEEIGIRAIACDLSAVSLRMAARRAPRGHFVQASALALPVHDATVDAAICEGVLHHTPSAGEGFRELVRVLRPGGVMFVSIYKRWRYYRLLYGTVGRMIRVLHRSAIGRRVVELTMLPFYHLVHIAKWRGAASWEGSKNFFYDYFVTPRASFHTRREVEEWARREDVVLIAYDGDYRSNCHSFVFRKGSSDRSDTP